MPRPQLITSASGLARQQESFGAIWAYVGFGLHTLLWSAVSSSVCCEARHQLHWQQCPVEQLAALAQHVALTPNAFNYAEHLHDQLILVLHPCKRGEAAHR